MAEKQRSRVLAVDDSEDVLELIMVTLGTDYDVVTLSNPVDLYEILDIFEPDLLILDVMMPKITGFQLIEMLRKNSGTKELPIIVLSAKSSAGEIKHGYKLGATLYLTKPFQPDRLLKNVETQFRVHPPGNRPKSLDLNEVAKQLESKAAYRKGHVQVSENIFKKDVVFDARKRLEDRIRKERGDTPE